MLQKCPRVLQSDVSKCMHPCVLTWTPLRVGVVVFECDEQRSFVRSFVRSFARSFVRLLVRSFVRLFVRSYLLIRRVDPRVRRRGTGGAGQTGSPVRSGAASFASV